MHLHEHNSGACRRLSHSSYPVPGSHSCLPPDCLHPWLPVPLPPTPAPGSCSPGMRCPLLAGATSWYPCWWAQQASGCGTKVSELLGWVGRVWEWVWVVCMVAVVAYLGGLMPNTRPQNAPQQLHLNPAPNYWCGTSPASASCYTLDYLSHCLCTTPAHSHPPNTLNSCAQRYCRLSRLAPHQQTSPSS
jgi:hypothetical protein